MGSLLSLSMMTQQMYVFEHGDSTFASIVLTFLQVGIDSVNGIAIFLACEKRIFLELNVCSVIYLFFSFVVVDSLWPFEFVVEYTGN